MAQFTIQGGTQLETATPAEVRAIYAEELAADRARARGYKWMRLPTSLQGKPSGSAITLGVTRGQPPVGPQQGYAWCLRRLVVDGLTAGATPDVVNLYPNDGFNGPPLWQFNGNNFGYTFGRSEMVLNAGDTLSLQSSGTIAATGLVRLSGELEEVPAEMLYKIR
jgi:hypothetical protein